MRKAMFVGKDGSLGFVNGKVYQIETWVENGFLWLRDAETGNKCPYERMEPLLDNWRVYSVHNEPVNWDDF